ncbi:MAG: cytochrome c biogenesis protein CcdA, partial [Actinomycetota bacterium]
RRPAAAANPLLRSRATMRARHLALLLVGIALLASACGGKGLGTGTVGQSIGQAVGYNAISYEPKDRVAPEAWTGTDLDGATVTSGSLQGSITVVNFWASWCPPCRVEQPGLVRVSQLFDGKGVRFLGVDIRDQRAAALAYLAEFAVPYPSISDPDSRIAHKFRMNTPPTTFVLDRKGRIAWKIIGAAREQQLIEILNLELSRVEPVAFLSQSKEGVKRAIAGSAGILVAFFVGVISFFTPCILPLLPGYLSYVSGVSGEVLDSGAQRKRVLAGTLLFMLGFAIIFTALGATASAVGGFLLDRFTIVERVAGVFVIAMGIAFLVTVFVPRLTAAAGSSGAGAALARGGLRIARVVGRERGIDARPKAGLIGAMPLGMAFAVGWVPCVGPGLATILTIAGTEGSALRGAVLLFSFSLGFGIWFILGGLAFRRATNAVVAIRRHLNALTLVGGVFMVAIGVMLVTNTWGELLAPIRRWVVRFTPPI